MLLHLHRYERDFYFSLILLRKRFRSLEILQVIVSRICITFKVRIELFAVYVQEI